ncbi:nitric oxide reductase activation protein NorD [Thiosocius teredinicola]|uniref:nitric oxide reductase activation protein NorD n=1 Tax=Thiosocius teredinicola TaxID=1973002 RepID=UPI0009914873
MSRQPLDASSLITHLDEYLEVEFTFIHTEELAAVLAAMPRDRQDFILEWTRRAAATNTELAFQFANRAKEALSEVEADAVASWCLHAMDSYDKAGLQAAMTVIRDLDAFLAVGHQRAAGSLFEEAVPVLLPFVQGLEGRRLKIEPGEFAWTDGEVLYLPEIVARLDNQADNFQLFKATVAHLWAQTRYGTLNVDLVTFCDGHPEPERVLALFHALETHRLDARIAAELPGLYRRMRALSEQLGDVPMPDAWQPALDDLARQQATVDDTLRWVGICAEHDALVSRCYQGRLNPAAAWAARLRRIERDKARLRESLRVIANELVEGRQDHAPPESFDVELPDPDAPNPSLQVEVTLSQQPLPIPDKVRDQLVSILLDLGEIPPEFLTPAGEGEYDPGLFDDTGPNPEDVWGGTYHEEGAYLYNEWDIARQAHKKNWCVLREIDVAPGDPGFYHATMGKYAGYIHSLRRTFEILRGEDKVLKRQTDGEDIDIDALVEAWSDVHSGLEMSDRLFTRMHKEERNIAVMFMVDMSGSTRGWINEAEREALILLAEALNTLGDRYAIYGFSGWTRKRCEAFKVKDFDDPWDENVIGRVCGIEPKDYTRMGAPIRHLVSKLKQVEARTKLLVTLSDGKPDDYDLEYRGEYGIEDTRQALFEARRDGVHAYCITIDREGQDYLPHMYGAANYTVLDDVAKLPTKVSDIYRKITT